jgi:chromosome segregation and condensation protein ScpB/DNA-binding transcriptional regulator YiaG
MAPDHHQAGDREQQSAGSNASNLNRASSQKTLEPDRQAAISPKEMRRWGENIRQRRRDLDLTLKQLADLTGISFSYLAKLERGDADARNPTRLVIDALRRTLNLPAPGGEHLSRTAMASWAAPAARDGSATSEDQTEDEALSPPDTSTQAPARWQLAEALLLISGRLSAAQLAAGLHCGLFEVEETIQELQHQLAGHGILIQEMNGEYQFASLDTLAPALRSALSAIGLAPRKQTQLTQAQREVLALVIMHQPITRSAIERYRGVDCERPLHALIEAELVEPLPATTPTGARQYVSTLRVLEESGYTSLEALHQAISKGAEALTLRTPNSSQLTD